MTDTRTSAQNRNQKTVTLSAKELALVLSFRALASDTERAHIFDVIENPEHRIGVVHALGFEIEKAATEVGQFVDVIMDKVEDIDLADEQTSQLADSIGFFAGYACKKVKEILEINQKLLHSLVVAKQGVSHD